MQRDTRSSEHKNLMVDTAVTEQGVPDNRTAPISPRASKSNPFIQMELSVLFKFIKPYDGSRETVNSFLINCNNAYDLASEAQKPILFRYILSKLQGKAEIACSNKDFKDWNQLREFLKAQFCERKHYAHLLTELQEYRQGPQDNVSQFALRVETTLSQLLTEVTMSNVKLKELPGRTTAMEDLALHHFLMGLTPRISNIVRCRDPKTLNEAINLAKSEERIQQSLYKRSQTDSRDSKPRQNVFKTPARPFPQQTHSGNPARQTSNAFCRYCKIPGHDITVCRKREYANNRYKMNNASSSQGVYKPTPRINFVDNSDEYVGHDEVDVPTDPKCHKKEVQTQIQKMLDDNIIQPSSSPWSSPIWIVPKKTDAQGQKKWRIVIDYRKLNDVTIGETYPIPQISEILDQLGSNKYFTTLDLASGFHQILINPEDAPKTAFSVPQGHFQFNRMPFGLKNAPSTFQKLMNTCLTGLQGTRCFVYLDDIVIYSYDLNSHISTLKEVFNRLRSFTLKLQPEKCEFLRKEVAYLGHIINENGVKPNTDKTKAVTQFPTPQSPKDIKSFLGLVSYYRRFIPNFAKLAKPLTSLLKKDIPFLWQNEQQLAFETLKDRLVSAPILAYPNFTQPFILTCDASNFAISAILSQGPFISSYCTSKGKSVTFQSSPPGPQVEVPVHGGMDVN
ncbi:hypothetical protein O3G_MSEX003922 [Manduca sexta]|uniref:Reverse transcriptase domain-containing protein n=1 Tax=Manduca sexta TaxID=7130 RepID=A0A921YV98_MANSE|nr:hypothetical protein O3G_MSEX003922 [Manduca sexta]